MSFGQGCEGEPTMNHAVIVGAIEKARAQTKRGIINVNTNGSRPETIRACAKAGASALRISINTFDREMYTAYYRPGDYDLPISAINHNTPFVPQGPAVMPGQYTVRLTVDGKSYTQPLNVRIDPRVTTPTTALQQQFDMSMQAYNGVITSTEMMVDVTRTSEQLRKAHDAAAGNVARLKTIEALQQKLRDLTGAGQRGGQGGAAQPTPVDQMQLGRLAGAFSSILDLLQDADAAPTSQAVHDLAALKIALTRSQTSWRALESEIRAAGIMVGSE
jgi:hypothetical protein